MKISLKLRTCDLVRDDNGYNMWQVKEEAISFKAEETALLICDIWDRHWSKGAEERSGILACRINYAAAKAREKGITVIHAPSDTMAYYKGSHARERITGVPTLVPPEICTIIEKALPIDDSGGGSDTGETSFDAVWTRQDPAIRIDEEKDVISDSGIEIYGYMMQKGIGTLIYTGVHTNLCILDRSFGIRQMMRWGIHTLLARDLTDSAYDPAKPPYVTHEEGTGLVIGYIEKFLCPSFAASDLLR